MIYWSIAKVLKGDTRSLDYSSCRGPVGALALHQGTGEPQMEAVEPRFQKDGDNRVVFLLVVKPSKIIFLI